MDDIEEQELQDLANWDTEHEVACSAGGPNHVVVAISLSSDDFDHLARLAERLEMPLTEFVRQAALDKARHHQESPAPIPQ